MYRQHLRMASSLASAAENLKVVIFLGSTREGRLGDRVCKFVKNWIAKNKNYQVTVMDPMADGFQELPMLKKPLHFYKEGEKDKIPPKLLEANEIIKSADAFLLISCEYNHCMPPALANMIDHFPGSSFSWRPSGLITYSPGIYGGMRAAMQLRAFTGEIGCISVSNIFGIPKVHEAIEADGTPTNDHMDKGLGTLIKQLEWTAVAMKNTREQYGIPK